MWNFKSMKTKYELRIGKDGFVRHKPCFYTQIMKGEQESIELYGKELRRLYQEKLDLPEWKEFCREMLNDAKSRYEKAKGGLEKWCVGSSTCLVL